MSCGERFVGAWVCRGSMGEAGECFVGIDLGEVASLPLMDSASVNFQSPVFIVRGCLTNCGGCDLQGWAHLDTAPFWNGFGAAMSSSPWEGLWNGGEDVATPLHAG